MNLARSSRRAFTLIEIMIVVAILGILIAIAVPAWMRQRLTSAQKACQENLYKIDGAKEQWALETGQGAVATPTEAMLYGETLFVRSTPICPAGGTYTINSLADRPGCSEATSPDFPHIFGAN
jgi:prepilin-type N-terminal cleavage/methylation domain-containing protein